MKVLVLNCGSSSVKFQVVEIAAGQGGSQGTGDGRRLLAKGVVDNIGGAGVLKCEAPGKPAIKAMTRMRRS